VNGTAAFRDLVTEEIRPATGIIRFQATLHEMEDTPGRSGAALASEKGFFDQAHLTLDLGRFAATDSR